MYAMWRAGHNAIRYVIIYINLVFIQGVEMVVAKISPQNGEM